MFNIKIADTVICIKNKYEYIRYMCRDYITKEPAKFLVSVSTMDMDAEMTGGEEMPYEYLETLAVYRKIAERVASENVFLLHGVLLSVDGRGILFCAASGVGKTTHANLWKTLLGDRCSIINGDKPLLRVEGGVVAGYGTPWCGKEEINENKRVEISDVCFIERGEENSIKPLPKEKILEKLLPSVHLPDGDGALLVLDLIDSAARSLRFWKTTCNMDISAAETAYNEIFK